jgi:hypothetical protein
MKMRSNLSCYVLFGALAFLGACQDSGKESQGDNPPMADFNMAGSDPKAIEIADEVMAAQGGRKNWDATHYLAWNFFGNRKLIWDKYTGQVRIESLKDDTKILVNINDGKGKVFKNGAEVTQPDSLAKYLDEGRKAWINDSYWLFMPFKLKDSGLTLKYLGEDKTQEGAPAEVLRLTFAGVGATPNNAYKVYVDKKSHLVTQWAHYREASQAEPNFMTPWKNYQTYGSIKLSGDRGERQITDIQVFDKLPETVFTSFAPVDLKQYAALGADK